MLGGASFASQVHVIFQDTVLQYIMHLPKNQVL